MEATKRCSYFHITDEDGKGQITRATGPRWDNLKKNINETIQTAKSQQGDAPQHSYGPATTGSDHGAKCSPKPNSCKASPSATNPTYA